MDKNTDPLAITPIDGRNKSKLKELSTYFSEFALDKYRIFTEIKYLEKLSEYNVIRKLSKKTIQSFNRLFSEFNQENYRQIRLIELKTNHDLKAVEEFIKLKLSKMSSKDVTSMVHFGLTSDDINNIAYALMIKESLFKVLIPKIEQILYSLKSLVIKNSKIPMLGRTHGQPAAPTTLGKEFLVYYKRLKNEIKTLKAAQIKAKLTGNTGNLNSHKFLYPKINWLKFSEELIEAFGLTPNLVTTQIEPYDSYINLFQIIIRINNILLGMSQDLWMYIMIGYFKQKVIKNEVGSSALPHKVNPIYFEGAEGGFGLANSLFEFYCRKLSYSRLQRDLSDSTVRRSFGIAFSYSLLSYQSVVQGLNRIEPKLEMIKQDLNKHWEILSEPIQNFLRTKGNKDAYDKTKKFFRGKSLAANDVLSFINKLKISNKDKQKLMRLSPEKYTGYAEEIIKKFII